MARLTAADFHWDQSDWVTHLTVNGWKYFTYVWDSDVEVGPNQSTGTGQLLFFSEGRGDEALTVLELSLVQWFVDHAEAVTDAVLDAIFNDYPMIQEDAREFAGAGAVPDVSSPRELGRLLSVPSVTIHDVQVEGVPYIGFYMDCPWDLEHGVGVKTHGVRVVEVGDGDVAG